MSQHTSIPFHSMLAFTLLAGFALPAAAVTAARVSESYGKLPLQFEANRGQTHQDVHFLSRGAGYSLYLTAGEAVLVLTKPNADAKDDARSAKTRGESVALRMSLVGAARKPTVSGTDELPGKANYFIGKDRSKWRTNVPTYARVHYREVYPGIDLVYYGNQRQLEYDFVVAPGANPKKIVLGFRGADKLEIDSQGELVLHTAGGDVRQHKPVIYQEIDGVRQEIAGSYVRKGADRVGFRLAAYDTTRPLIIDPVLAYSTYLGSSGDEQGAAIAVDRDGSAYVIGTTNGADFPATAGTLDASFNGLLDVFVTKLNATGSVLIYSTFLGGSDADQGLGIAVDANGAAYVTGSASSADFPTTAGAFDTTYNGSGDAFVTKLDPSRSALDYSTFLGGTSVDEGNSIAVDATGAAYVTGKTDTRDFPTTVGALDTTSGCCGFVTKLNSTGSVLVYSTFLKGAAGFGIAVDTVGSAYITGDSFGGFPTTPGAFQPSAAGGDDAFVAKLNADGTGLIYSSYLAGSGGDRGSGIAVDASCNAYVTGATASTNFPTTTEAFQPAFGGNNNDAFVAKIADDTSPCVPPLPPVVGM